MRCDFFLVGKCSVFYSKTSLNPAILLVGIPAFGNEDDTFDRRPYNILQLKIRYLLKGEFGIVFFCEIKSFPLCFIPASLSSTVLC